jgi:hypothetical protein
MVYFMCMNSCLYKTKRKPFFLIWLLSHAKLIINISGWIDPPIECAHQLTTLTSILMNLYNQLYRNSSKTVISLSLFVSLRRVMDWRWCLVSIWNQLIFLKGTNLPLEAVNVQIQTNWIIFKIASKANKFLGIERKIYQSWDCIRQMICLKVAVEFVSVCMSMHACLFLRFTPPLFVLFCKIRIWITQ